MGKRKMTDREVLREIAFDFDQYIQWLNIRLLETGHTISEIESDLLKQIQSRIERHLEGR